MDYFVGEYICTIDHFSLLRVIFMYSIAILSDIPTISSLKFFNSFLIKNYEVGFQVWSSL